MASSALDSGKYGSSQFKDMGAAAGRWRKVDFPIRFLAFVGTLVACVVIGTDKQTVQFVGIPLRASYRHTPAFVYFLIANAICCGYLLVSLVLSFLDSRKPSGTPSSTRRLVFFIDLIMFGLILSASSSAATVAYIAFKGDPHANWGATCGLLNKFCHQGLGAASGSFFAVGMFIPLIVLPAYGLIN